LEREAIDELADRIALAAAHIDSATHELLVDIHRFDCNAGWAAQGAKSCAHWLSWRIGVGLVAAREQVRVARALAALPLIAAAMQRGELSYAKVRAITRVATSDNEQLLLDMARGATGAQLERLCGKFRALDRLGKPDVERRFVARRYMPDGTVRIELRLHPDEAERVWKALQAIRQELVAASFDDSAEKAGALNTLGDPAVGDPAVGDPALGAPTVGDPAVGDPAVGDPALGDPALGDPAVGAPAVGDPALGAPAVGHPALGHPALAHPALADCARGPADGPGPAGSPPAPPGASAETPEAAPDAPMAAAAPAEAGLPEAVVAMAERALLPRDGVRRPPRAEPFQLFVHLREERVADTELGWQAELHDGTTLAGATLLRIACDCGVVVAKTDARGNVLDIGRRRRRVSAALRRALLLRDRHCRFPGCTAAAFVEAHHIEHWAHFGPTSLANTLLLCHGHHVCVHEGGFRVERDADSNPIFLDPVGRVIATAPAAPPLDGDGASLLRGAAEARGLALHPKGALPKWNGYGLDLGAAVGALAGRAYPNPL
jgi:hypothetical protein